jgi:hypothetical protein
MHWSDSAIDNANYDAFLLNVSPHAALQTYPGATKHHNHHQDFDTEMRELDDMSFLDLKPSEMYESLPLPKGYKPHYHMDDKTPRLAAPTMMTLEPTPTKDFTASFLFEPRDETMMLMPNFVSPRVMSFAQGFGLDHVNPRMHPHEDYNLCMTSGNTALNFQLEDFSMSPLFHGSKLDFGIPSIPLPPAAVQEGNPIVEIIEQYPEESNSAPAVSFTGFQENEAPKNPNLSHRLSSDEGVASNSRPISEIASSCHHCKRRRHPNELKACHRGAGAAVSGKKGTDARRCCRKRYCISCLQKYGISFAEADEPGWTCMACRGACECAACRRKSST